MRTAIKNAMLLSIVVFVAWQYAHFTWDQPWRAEQIVNGLEERPYVYRALVPFLARMLTWTGMRAEVALSVMVVVSGLLLFVVISRQSSGERGAWGVVAFVVIFFMECKVYDLATAFFFALGLQLMEKQSFDQYFAAFAFASVNRETTFLLTLVFGVYFGCRFQVSGFKWLALAMGYQGFLFAAIRVCLMIIFAGNSGATMLIRPGENISLLLHPAWVGVLHVIVIASLFVAGLRSKVEGLNHVAFWVMMPVLLIMYLVVGVIGEIRVFAEVFPVVYSFLRTRVL